MDRLAESGSGLVETPEVCGVEELDADFLLAFAIVTEINHAGFGAQAAILPAENHRATGLDRVMAFQARAVATDRSGPGCFLPGAGCVLATEPNGNGEFQSWATPHAASQLSGAEKKFKQQRLKAGAREAFVLIEFLGVLNGNCYKIFELLDGGRVERLSAKRIVPGFEFLRASGKEMGGAERLLAQFERSEIVAGFEAAASVIAGSACNR
jgi:hypothetical protein